MVVIKQVQRMARWGQCNLLILTHESAKENLFSYWYHPARCLMHVFPFTEQTTEDGGEGEALHGAAEEEDGEGSAEDDEEGAEDRRQAFITF